jgi:CO/xanthine dehydrogenase FAD-binding subunit
MAVLKEVFFPKSIQEVLLLKDKYRENATFIAGSTSLGLRRHPPKSFLIDLNQAGISFIKEQNTKFKIGAATPVNWLMTNKGLNQAYNNLFFDACTTLGSSTLRNMITVGGNVYFSLPWSDLPPLFYVLAAKFRLKSDRGERILSPEEFFKNHPSQIIEKDEVLIQLDIPKPRKNQRFSFHKFAQTETDYAIVTIAISFLIEDGKINYFRSAIGGMYNPVIGLSKIDKFLLGKTVHSIHEDGLKDLLNSLPTPLKDTKFSQNYRKNVAANLFLDMVKNMGDK